MARQKGDEGEDADDGEGGKGGLQRGCAAGSPARQTYPGVVVSGAGARRPALLQGGPTRVP